MMDDLLLNKNGLIPAATIMLLRNHMSGLEVFMIMRNSSMTTAAGALAFPGGKMDHIDIDADIDFDILCENLINAFKITAIRETFEEVNLLFARREDKNISKQDVDRLSQSRIQHAQNDPFIGEKINFAASCRTQDLELDLEALHLTARWITPDYMSPRFDTYFFIAEAPEGQIPVHDGIEATSSFWARPNDILSQYETGKTRILPPTFCALKDLSSFSNVQEAMINLQRDKVEPVQPLLKKVNNQHVIHIPGRNLDILLP